MLDRVISLKLVDFSVEIRMYCITGQYKRMEAEKLCGNVFTLKTFSLLSINALILVFGRATFGHQADTQPDWRKPLCRFSFTGSQSRG